MSSQIAHDGDVAAPSHVAFCSPLDAAQIRFSRRVTWVCTWPALGDTRLQEARLRATGLPTGAWRGGGLLQGSTSLKALGRLRRRSWRVLRSRDKLPLVESQLTSPFPEAPLTRRPCSHPPPRGPCSQLTLQLAF